MTKVGCLFFEIQCISSAHGTEVKKESRAYHGRRSVSTLRGPSYALEQGLWEMKSHELKRIHRWTTEAHARADL